jgi:hypothetical protein
MKKTLGLWLIHEWNIPLKFPTQKKGFVIRNVVLSARFMRLRAVHKGANIGEHPTVCDQQILVAEPVPQVLRHIGIQMNPAPLEIP